MHSHVLQGISCLCEYTVLLGMESIAKSVAAAVGPHEYDHFLVTDYVDPVMNHLVCASWLQRDWISHTMFKIDLHLYALRQLCHGSVLPPVEPFFGPLIDLSVLTIEVEGFFMEVMMVRLMNSPISVANGLVV